MRIRTFLAKDMKEALAAMRSELGDDAIIVASERLKDGSLCLRAGTEKTDDPPATAEASKRDMSSGGDESAHLATFEDRYREGLLARLRTTKTTSTNRKLPFDRSSLLHLLLAHRTPERIAISLVEKAAASGLEDMTLALASALDEVMRRGSAAAGDGKSVLLVGPPGSGKTAVAAKLAAQRRLAGLPVALVATDLETAGQADRLECFAACLDLLIVRLSEPDALAKALREAQQTQTLLVADTAGCDPRVALAPEMHRFLAIGELDIVAVLSATMDAEEAAETAAAFLKLGATKLIVTGLDLARRKGALLSLAVSGLPIAHVTASPYLAAGLETLTPLALSRALTGSTFITDSREAA